MKRKQLMQFHIERERVGCNGAPAFYHSRIGHGIEGRIDLDHFEMLRIPPEPLGWAHFLRIPTLDESGVRPTRRSDKNFSSHVDNFGSRGRIRTYDQSVNSRPLYH